MAAHAIQSDQNNWSLAQVAKGVRGTSLWGCERCGCSTTRHTATAGCRNQGCDCPRAVRTCGDCGELRASTYSATETCRACYFKRAQERREQWLAQEPARE